MILIPSRALLLVFCSLLVLASRAATVPAAHGPPATEQAAIELLQSICNRLLVAHDVARAKWQTGKPIHDPQRETAILEEMARRGELRHLGAEQVRKLFSAQFQAGKQIQAADFRIWQAARQPAFRNPRSLSDLRQTIDRLNENLLQGLAAARVSPATWKSLARQYVAGPGITDEVRQLAVAPLMSPPGRTITSHTD
jgi:chorismate mutase